MNTVIYNFPTNRPSTSTQAHYPVLGLGLQLDIADTSFQHGVATTKSHAAEPIKSREDILKIQDYLIAHGRYRDNLLIACGFNLGLRASDLLKLRIGHLLNTDGSYNDEIVVQEDKTQKMRRVFPNDAVRYAADLYFTDIVRRSGVVDLNTPLFPNKSPNAQGKVEPISRRSLDRILKEVINGKCGLSVHASTHCLRKTFAYHYIMTASDRTRAIELLQKTFGHSSMAVTLYYAGITDDEIMETYAALNLGYSCDRGIGRVEEPSAC